MGLETVTYVAELVITNPSGAADDIAEGDDHIRNIKKALKNTFPNFAGTAGVPKSVTLTEDQINDAALRSAVQTITGAWTFTDLLASTPGSGTKAIGVTYASGSGPSNVVLSTLVQAGNTSAWRLTQSGVTNWDLINAATTGSLQITNSVATLTLAITGALTYSHAATFNGALTSTASITDAAGDVRDVPRRTSAFAQGQCTAISAGITLNTSDMSAGRTFSVYNDSGSNITITQGAGVTLRLNGTASTGNRTLLARGICTIWCNSGTEAVVSGAVT